MDYRLDVHWYELHLIEDCLKFFHEFFLFLKKEPINHYDDLISKNGRNINMMNHSLFVLLDNLKISLEKKKEL